MPSPGSYPEDLLRPIFEKLVDHRDLHSCSLVSSTFNHAVTPILYKFLTTTLVLDLSAGNGPNKSAKLYHPIRTLLDRPELAEYVRHTRGTASIHKLGTEFYEQTLESLRRCAHLESFDWTDDTADRLTRHSHTDPNAHDLADRSLRGCIQVLQTLHITDLAIRTYSGLSVEAWNEMRKLAGLKRLALWCMEGQPRVLQGWSELLGPTLTHLELGRCQGVPSTILLTVLSHLPLLQSLGIKGAHSSTILEIMTILPHLTSLDTDYHSSGPKVMRSEQPLIARIRHLTVRTNDLGGPYNIWIWMKQLVSYPCLETFRINAFSSPGDVGLPRRFILDLARLHEKTLKQVHVTGAGLALQDILCVCSMFPLLEELSWSVMFSNDITEIGSAIESAKNLKKIHVDADWVTAALNIGMRKRAKFMLEDAEEIMNKEGSQVRSIHVSGATYKGRWYPHTNDDGTTTPQFEVARDDSGYNWLQN